MDLVKPDTQDVDDVRVETIKEKDLTVEPPICSQSTVEEAVAAPEEAQTRAAAVSLKKTPEPEIEETA